MKISVYITSYNQKAYLIEAIESVLAQTLPPHQIIIVDDASSDGSQEVIRGYAARYPDRITPIFHTQNTGVAQARNDALKAVTGDYVTYLDGDDRFLPQKLQKESQQLRDNPWARIAFSDYYLMDANGKHKGVWAGTSPVPQGNVICQTLARDFPRRSLFRNELVHYHTWQQVGFYDPQLNLYEDWEMRIRLTNHCQVVFHRQPLVEKRIHKKGLSRVSAAQHMMALEYILRKNQPLLESLTQAERAHVHRKLRQWRARLIRRKAREALIPDDFPGSGRKQALQQYWRSLKYDFGHHDYKLLARIFLPRMIYEHLRSLGQKEREHISS
jgi:glycosyltransferase involved in cell wall biosynthesis